MKDRKVQAVKVHIGVQIAGSVFATLKNGDQVQGLDMELTPVGVYVRHLKDRALTEVLVPFSNVQYLYLQPEEEKKK